MAVCDVGKDICMHAPRNRRELLALGGAAGAAWALAGATTAHAQPTSAPDATGYSLVTEQRSDGRYGIAVTDATGTVVARQTAPIQVSVKVGDFPVDCSTGYATVSSQADELHASGTVTTPAGSGYRFDDVYAADGTSVLLSRAVTVDTANDLREMAFCSRFALGPVRGGDLTSYDVFYPGMWYGDARRRSRDRGDIAHHHVRSPSTLRACRVEFARAGSSHPRP
jgi:hypothetical protein